MRKQFSAVLLLAILLSCCAFGLERQSNADYHARRVKLGNAAHGAVIVMFADTEANQGDVTWGFHQDENFYYLTGLAEPGAALVIVSAMEARGDQPAREYQEMLFLPKRNMVQERWTGPKLGADSGDVHPVTGFDKVLSVDALPGALAQIPGPVRVWTDTPTPTHPTTVDTAAIDGLVRLNAFPNGMSMQDVKPALGEIRKVKDAGEIALLTKAGDATAEAHVAALRAMKPNATEREISALMQYEFERRGCERPAYAPIVGSGFNGTVLHYMADAGTIRDGDVVVMDVAGEYSYYAMDLTRTLPANGKFTARQREIYEIVLGAQQAAIDAFVAGKSKLRGNDADSLNKLVVDYFNTHGKDLHGQPLGKYFIHGLGHFVGMNVHDPGDSTLPLDKGMVFTLEPGLYIPEEKIGVRIEDTFAVGEDGKLINLTGKAPKSPADIERIMAGSNKR